IAVGDLVAICSMRDASYDVCKRVIGLAGDTILIDPRSENAAKSDSSENEPRYIVVPPGHIWLTGDNMANSTDSRDYGPVPLGMIRGRVIARV
ncbi:LexA/Signal peptidase, partial [Meira miltonrushii]